MWALIIILILLIYFLGNGMFILVPFVIIVIAAYLVIKNNNQYKDKSRLKEELLEIENFNPSISFVLGDGSFLFAIDKQNELVTIIDRATTYTYPFEDILGVEMLQNDILITSKSTSRTIGGALLGGMLAGGAGMVVGGLSGVEETHKQGSDISLILTVKDFENSTLVLINKKAVEMHGTKRKWHRVNAADTGYSDEVLNLFDFVKEIQSIISIIIDRVDRQSMDFYSPKKESSADEIVKYHKLFQEGIITEEEFELQKYKILNRD